MSSLGEVIKTAQMIQADAQDDAAALDRTPFSPRGMGETLGAQLAMISACARMIELLALRVILAEEEA